MARIALPEKSTLLLIFIIVLGFVLRLWGIDFGLPHLYHQDEPIVVNHALAYGTGDFNPHFFIVPPLCSYLLFVAYGFYFLLGKIAGFFSSPDSFALYFFTDPSNFYIIARVILGLIPSTLSILLVYKVYTRFFGSSGSLYASVIAAFSFLPVINSHYSYTDNLMVMFILLCYLSFIRIVDHPNGKNYLISGVLTGLAVSTKYNAAILSVSFLISHILSGFNNEKKKIKILLDRKMMIFGISAACAFLATNPFSVLDWEFFISQTFGGIRRDYMGWSHHISYSMIEGIGVGLVVMGFLGFFAILKKEKLSRSILFFSFPAIFYLHLVYASQPFSRYVLPLIPFFAMGVSYFLFKVLCPSAKNRVHMVLVVSLSVLLLLPTALKSVKACILFSGQDTRTVSKKWIEDNIDPYSKIAADHTSFRPSIFQTQEQLAQKIEIAGFQKGLKDIKSMKIDLEKKAVSGKKTYNLYFLTYEDEIRGQFLSTVPAVSYDIDLLRDEGIEYVTINMNTTNPEKEGFIDDLNASSEMVAVFSPYRGNSISQPYDKVDHTFMAIGTRELFSRSSTGPVIMIYRIRKR